MMRLAMSRAASGLLRALVGRAGISRDRILLIEWFSREWQSLTFSGERHEARLRVCGPDAPVTMQRLTSNLGEAEFELCGHIVADIRLLGEPQYAGDGSVVVAIEALTIAE